MRITGIALTIFQYIECQEKKENIVHEYLSNVYKYAENYIGKDILKFPHFGNLFNHSADSTTDLILKVKNHDNNIEEILRKLIGSIPVDNINSIIYKLKTFEFDYYKQHWDNLDIKEYRQKLYNYVKELFQGYDINVDEFVKNYIQEVHRNFDLLFEFFKKQMTKYGLNTDIIWSYIDGYYKKYNKEIPSKDTDEL